MQPAQIAQARSRIAAGDLPHTHGVTLGGPSRGSMCDLCRKPIGCGSPEIEITGTFPGSYSMHPGCFVAWMLVVRERPRTDVDRLNAAPAHECCASMHGGRQR